MTLVSLTVPRPPLASGVPVTSMCTTVSTEYSASTRAIVGCRMSACRKSAPPRWCAGGTASTPITRSTSGSRWILRTNRPPSCRATPVTSTTLPKISAYLPSQPRRAPQSLLAGHVSGSMLRCDVCSMQEVTTATLAGNGRFRSEQLPVQGSCLPVPPPLGRHPVRTTQCGPPTGWWKGHKARCTAAAAYFLLRRCTRVRFSSLRCFFFAIRLRRFLMTEPTTTLAHFSDNPCVAGTITRCGAALGPTRPTRG